ncbi:MAG: hypothetical protein ACI4VF_04855 [Lachnospirales bacterium]
MKKVNCKEVCCIFNADKICIKDEINLEMADNCNYISCANKVIVSDDELKRIKDYHISYILERVNEEIAQEKFKSENLQKQIEENDKIIAEMKKNKTNEILDKAREKAHPLKNTKDDDLYSISDLEDMYIRQGMSLMKISDITGIPKSTIFGRLKAAGITDKKKAINK